MNVKIIFLLGKKDLFPLIYVNLDILIACYLSHKQKFVPKFYFIKIGSTNQVVQKLALFLYHPPLVSPVSNTNTFSIHLVSLCGLISTSCLLVLMLACVVIEHGSSVHAFAQLVVRRQ